MDTQRRSGRHRQGLLARKFPQLEEWYRGPFDYEWVSSHAAMRPIRHIMQIAIALSVLEFALGAVIALASSVGPTGAVIRGWLIFMVAVQIGTAAMWVLRPFPKKTGLIVFGIYGDLGVTSVLVTFPDKTNSIIGCILFVLTGAYFTFFLSSRWLIAHLVFTTVVILTFATMAWGSGSRDSGTILAGANVVLVSVNGVPLFIQLAWAAVVAEAKQSTIDSLTGLLNRRGLDSALDALWRRAQQNCLGIAVLVVDIDNFKRINDRFGHSEGDTVIIRVGEILTHRLNKYGVVGRTGGEEYLCAFAAEDRMLDRAVEGIENSIRSDLRTVPGPVTVSIGVALVYATPTFTESGRSVLDEAARIADVNMYRAKTAGGNRVVATGI